MEQKLLKVMGEIERITDSFDRPELKMDANEFGERMMHASVLATSYSVTAHADDMGRVTYRRLNNIRVGVSAAAVYALKGDAVMSQAEFVNQTTKIYMAYEGIPLTAPDYTSKKLYCRAVIYSYLDRLKSLRLISTFVSNGIHYVKLEPELNSCSFAMLMDPESTLRTPYMKATAQTVGGMAAVDKNQAKLTEKEVADVVSDSLIAGNVLESSKPAWRFAMQNITPLHQSNHVPFFSTYDEDKLIVLPTFPEPGSVIPPEKLISPLLSPELATEIFGVEEVEKLSSGLNPPLVTVTSPSSGSEVYFYHYDPVITAYGKHLKVSPSRFTPQTSVAIAVFSELQSKLSFDFEPLKVAHIIQMFALGDRVKVAELGGSLERKVYSVLRIRSQIIQNDPSGYVVPATGCETILRDLIGICNIGSPANKQIAAIAREVA